MKLLHTSDWHLGKRLENFSRFEEQKEVLKEICAIAEAEHVDAVFIAGDLFDTYNPPTEAVELFYKTLKRLANNGKRPVIAIAGNHDSPDRIDAPDPLARECGIIFAGYPNALIAPFELETGLRVIKSDEGFIEIQLPGINYPMRVLLTPYANEMRLKAFLGSGDSEEEMRQGLSAKWNALATRYCDNNGVNFLVSHLFVARNGDEIAEEPEDEKPILYVGGAQVVYSDNVPTQVQYAAFGHLHRKQLIDNSSCPIVYSGSPLSYSFAEADQDKYVVIIEAEPGKEPTLDYHLLKSGKRLLRKKADGIAEALAWLQEHQEALVELTLVTENYLTADERKMLSKCHDGIISIIPEMKKGAGTGIDNEMKIDLTKGIEGLFYDYFCHEKGQPPNQQVMNLLKEVLSEEEAL